MNKLEALKKKIKEAGFKTKKVDITEKHIRFRQESPSKFQKGSFRTLDVGRQGGMKLIIGRPKGKKTTRVQSVIYEK